MNRINEIDNFLKYWATIYAQNPNYEVNENVLYKALMEYGLTNQEKQNHSLEPLFPKWISYFQNDPNLDVYHDQSQAAFLQFESKQARGSKHVKLYLSYPTDKMEYCINKIFSFISQNHIIHHSKVAKRLRSDAATLRIADYNDALKVMDFINNDSELTTYAKPTNPFMLRNGVVGLAYDDNISYNDTLAMLLQFYFIHHRQTKMLDMVSSQDFQMYVIQFVQNIFRNGEELQKFYNMSNIRPMTKRFDNKAACLLNYEQVLNLIIEQLDDNMNLEKYHSFYESVCNDKNNTALLSYYTQFLQTPTLKQKTNNINTYNLVIQACIATYEKYGYQQLSYAIMSGLQGNYAYFTNDKEKYRTLLQRIPRLEFNNICRAIALNYGQNTNSNLWDICARVIEGLIVKNTNNKVI